MHRLDGAYERITRANEHVDALLSIEADSSKQANEIGITVTENAGTQKVTLPDGSEFEAVLTQFTAPTIEFPLRIGVLFGECIYNTRAALDYLVFELAKADSDGIEQEGTQFPIEDSESGFLSRCNEARRHGVFLRGLSEQHKLAIREFQPVFGCLWTRDLRDFSNPDKHRQLMALQSKPHYSLVSDAIDMRAPMPTGVPIPLRLRVDGDIAVQIALIDGSVVVPQLQQLISQVSDTLAEFHPCLNGSCQH